MDMTLQATSATAAPGLAAVAQQLANAFAGVAAEVDADDRFVADNYALLREAEMVEVGVPQEFGGGGAEVRDLANMLRILAHGCSSTALAFAMHTHQVAIPAWRWRHRNVAAVEPLLRRIATERIILLSSGGSDWIGGSGSARPVEGGYRVSGRKIFTSGAPAGDILMTGAILEEDGERYVLHFGAPMRAPGVRIEETWRALGMRGTGSHDVIFEDLFIAEAAVALRRRAGEWHPLFEIIATIAFPLIYGVYLGVAESARDLALDLARRKPAGRHTAELAGRMETALRAAQFAHHAMIAEVERNDPSAASVNEVMIGRSLVAEHAIAAVEWAMELAGGVGFYRSAGLERRFRDIQGARYHPLHRQTQAEYAGAMALGLSVATIY